jgi:hypothetical protein
MLRSLNDLDGYTLSASDGDLGSVVNFLFDDQQWTIRYLVADTDRFFDRRRVLTSPVSLRQADWSTRRLHVALTRERIQHSPSVDTDKPVSRQHERDYSRYYGYPYYWGYTGLWGMGAYPGWLAAGSWHDTAIAHLGEEADLHLRSAREVRGYHIQGRDDVIGHVEDFIVDDETWELRYLVIDTSNWWFGKKVLVAPHWANLISWEERMVYVDLPRQAIKNSPAWNAGIAVNREYETRLYDYYARPVYWDSNDRLLRASALRHVASLPR